MEEPGRPAAPSHPERYSGHLTPNQTPSHEPSVDRGLAESGLGDAGANHHRTLAPPFVGNGYPTDGSRQPGRASMMRAKSRS